MLSILSVSLKVERDSAVKVDRRDVPPVLKLRPPAVLRVVLEVILGQYVGLPFRMELRCCNLRSRVQIPKLPWRSSEPVGPSLYISRIVYNLPNLRGRFTQLVRGREQYGLIVRVQELPRPSIVLEPIDVRKPTHELCLLFEKFELL